MIQKALLILFILFISASLEAEEKGEAKAIALCNSVIRNVSEDILAKKDRYSDLSGFNEEALMKGSHKQYILSYTAPILEGKKAISYAFGLTCLDGDEKSPFKRKGKRIKREYPLLDLKIVGYQKKRLMKQLDIRKILDQHAKDLSEYQQQYLPFRLVLKAEKDTFKIHEPIIFTAYLTNVTNKSLLLQTLNANTLFLNYNKKIWGAAKASKRGSKGIRTIVLRPGKILSEKFIGEGFPLAQQIEIMAEYAVPFQGVKATSLLNVNITK